MARAFGSDGGITFITGHNAVFMRWGLQIGQGYVDETGYGDSWGVGKATGVKRAAFSAFGYPLFNVANATPGGEDISAAGGAIVLTVAAGCTYSFNGVITSFNVATDFEGQATLAYVGSATAAITEAWDETP